MGKKTRKQKKKTIGKLKQLETNHKYQQLIAKAVRQGNGQNTRRGH